MAYRYDKDELPDAPEAREQGPVDEHAEMLQGRLANAEKRIVVAERELTEWTPVRESCRAGLKALQGEPMKAVA